LQYDNLKGLIRRIEQLYRKVQYPTRKLEETRSTAKEVIIKRMSMRAKISNTSIEIDHVKEFIEGIFGQKS